MKKLIVFILLTLSVLSCTKQIDYSKDINELKTQLGTLQNQINQLQKTTDSLNNELKITKSQVNVMSTRIDSLYKRIDIVSSQILNLTTELNSKFSQLSKQISSDKTELTKSIGDLINQISIYQKELSELTKQINDVKNSIIDSQGFEVIPVDPLLKSNGKGLITVPVVIINYLPTVDDVYIDTARAYNSNQPWGEIHKYTLDRARKKILSEKIIEKNYIEEGSRFRDFGTNQVKPYINIDVVAYINVKNVKLLPTQRRMVDLTTGTKDDGINNPVSIEWNLIDFNELLTRINLKNYVEGLGVKEVWFTAFPRENGINNCYNIAESNMSGPNGDISNGGNVSLTDLPVYSKTYVVYGFNGWRGVDTDLHNRGHQIESQMKHIDMTTWNKFAKTPYNDGVITHYPPNAKNAYDYGNLTSSKSDLMTWKPSGGTSVDLNVYSWLNKSYQFEKQINMISTNQFANGVINYSNDFIVWPERISGSTTEIKYHVFWWQSMPGYNNNIEENGKKITNWWDIFYNWDDAIKDRKKLIQ
jgi:hypothetical protein